MRSNKDRRSRDLAKIHLAKNQLGLDEVAYREMLFNVAGVSSAADLDNDGRNKVLKHFMDCGYRFHHKSAKKSGMHLPSSPDREPLLSKIEAQLTSLGVPWSYADSIAKHVYKVSRVRWLKPEQLKVIMLLLGRQKSKEINKNTSKKGD